MAHDIEQLGEDEIDVGGFGGTVARDFLGNLFEADAAHLAGTGEVTVGGAMFF